MSRAHIASRQHVLRLDTPLPTQQVVLGVIENKKQVIELICISLIEKVIKQQRTGMKTDVTIIAQSPVPDVMSEGCLIPRPDLISTHEEADVLIAQHVCRYAEQETCIKVICDDTDVYVLLMYFYQTQNLQCTLLMQSPISGRSVLDVGASASRHAAIIPYLLAAHALTGCDTVAYMFGIGKATMLKVLESGAKLQSIGEEIIPTDRMIAEATPFVARLYGRSGDDLVDVRYKVANLHHFQH